MSWHIAEMALAEPEGFIPVKSIKTDKARLALTKAGIDKVYFFVAYDDRACANLCTPNDFPWEAALSPSYRFDEMRRALSDPNEGGIYCAGGCGLCLEASLDDGSGYNVVVGISGVGLHVLKQYKHRLPEGFQHLLGPLL
ncbi:MAG: hypothetical protein HY514_02885 [Candidatus Aenigmarchaeota archaeon]|nr:hypothetical protein [Candidatus Aenigmarchaeota archaeon]